MILTDILKHQLNSQGLRYTENGDCRIQLVLGHSMHRWDVVFEADDESFLRYYARYPWEVPEERKNNVLGTLNSLNAKLRAGCFMLDDKYVYFRYGVYIFDAFTAGESVADLLLTASAQTNSAWNEIYEAISSFERADGV